MANLSQVNSAVEDRTFLEQYENLWGSNPSVFTLTSAHMPEFSTGRIYRHVEAPYPIRDTASFNSDFEDVRSLDWPNLSQYYIRTTPSTIGNNEQSTGYFILKTGEHQVRIPVNSRPTQETLDELYDLFGWYYVDI